MPECSTRRKKNKEKAKRKAFPSTKIKAKDENRI
jgi:hypothetical protein